MSNQPQEPIAATGTHTHHHHHDHQHHQAKKDVTMKEVLAELHALSNNPATEWLTESFEKLIPNFSERKADILKVLEVLIGLEITASNYNYDLELVCL